MSSPYIGEIRMFAGTFEPNGWMICNGRALVISEYETLFQLIGTTFGGDGETTFNLPDLQGRIPVHQGQGPGLQNYQLGETAGVEQVTLTNNSAPLHTHFVQASNDAADSTRPQGNVPAAPLTTLLYYASTPVTPLGAAATAPSGGSQPHNNLQPYLCVNFIIAVFGVFPAP